ncbi:MAG: hypothetical protein M0002_14070 [Rhodospirillales bacterium]|nr:hypothetical protein [Rhodospirillales bacterium]
MRACPHPVASVVQSRTARSPRADGGASPTPTLPSRGTLPSPKALIVRPAPPGVVRPLIVEHHYLHSMPSAAWRCFAVFAGADLVGAMVFTAGARQGHRALLGASPQQVATLARLWLRDEIPKNAESRVIGVVLRILRRDGRWKLLLSYADPAAGHVGTIYQATGWLYLGQGAPPSYVDLGDGRALHPRTVYDRLGSNAVGHLRRTGIPARQAVVSGKHRYAYVLDPAWRWRLRDRPRPYPRAVVP